MLEVLRYALRGRGKVGFGTSLIGQSRGRDGHDPVAQPQR
jgi:hypothetical protein